MDRRCIVLAIVTLLAIIGSGCLTTTGGSEEPTSTISLDLQDNETPSGHRITGEILLRFLNTEQAFDGITVCGYDDEGTLLTSQVVGDMEPISTAAVNITTGERPTYVVVDHPRFRAFDLGFRMIDWRDGVFRDEGVRSPEKYINEFEYVPPTEVGECGATQPVEG